jgi:translation elongation factor EF-Tu-like GTPase
MVYVKLNEPKATDAITMCQLVAHLYLLPTEQGGRQTAIKERVYRPRFYLHSVDSDCRIDKLEQEKMHPGERGRVTMTLLYPERFGDALRPGQAFELHEGLKTVAQGTILEVVSVSP